MRELSDAIARGALARVMTLRNERLTRDAQRLLDVLLDPRGGSLGKVPDAAAEQYSPQALLYERTELERAYLLTRQERPEAIDKARSILTGILTRVGPRAAIPYLDGETRVSILLDVANAFSQLCDEQRAIDITKYVLARAGLPTDVSLISDYVQDTPSVQKYASRFAVQLSNLTIRRSKLAYLAAFGGDLEPARDQLDQAYIEGQQSLRLRPNTGTPWAITGRLVSRANLACVELERVALLIDDIDERARALEEVERTAKAILIESYEASFILPRDRLVRANQLGMVLIEQACIWEKRGKTDRAESLALTARVSMKANRDAYKIDADEPFEPAVRYGDACRLSGAIPIALSTWRRSRERLVLYRGADLPAIKALDKRIEALQSRNEAIG